MEKRIKTGSLKFVGTTGHDGQKWDNTILIGTSGHPKLDTIVLYHKYQAGA